MVASIRYPRIPQPVCAVILCLLACLAPPAHGQTREAVVAKAGNTFISEREFRERFELLPALGRHRKPKLEEAKLTFLYSMVAEKLLADEALDRGLANDSLYANGLQEVRKLLARDELYRREISDSVHLTPAEIRQGMERARKRLMLSYIFFSHEDDAQFVKSRIHSLRDLQMLHIDTTVEALRDTITLTWGNAEPAIEEAAFNLSVGQVSPLVRAGNGWYLLALKSVDLNPEYDGMQLPAMRERVESKLHLRAENVRLNEFMPQFLQGKVGYTVEKIFSPFAGKLTDVLRADASQDSMVLLMPETAARLRSECRGFLGDTLIAAGTERWTVADVIERLTEKSFAVPRAELLSVPQRLNRLFRDWVEHELLAEAALKQGLDQTPEVRRQLDVWLQFYLAESMKARVRQSAQVSDAEVWQYMHDKGQASGVPQVQLRELRTATLEDMYAAMTALEKGTPFEEVVARWSNDPAERKSGGLTPFFAITDRAPIGDIASRMMEGEQYGPLAVPGGQIFFEVVNKRIDSASVRGVSESTREEARKNLLAMKQRRAVTLFLAQIGQSRGFSVYEDRLQMLKVTSSPMMTYRILGFGGRMFAVPFVDPQLDWLDVEAPAEKILP